MSKPTAEERFWARVAKNASGCWHWNGRHKPTGYAIVAIGGTTRHAHRVAYELAVGPVPVGLELDHVCRNRGCVNPDHLEPVTHQENARRGSGNQWRGRTHCVHGHPLSGENVKPYLSRGRSPSRACRTCVRSRARKYRQQRRDRAA